MTILIDIRPLMDTRYSGVAEYTRELITALLELDTVNQYILFYNSFHQIKERLPVFSQANVRIVATHIPNKLFNYGLLTIFRRPLLDRLCKTKIDILFLPHLNFAAWSPQTKSVITIHDLSFLDFPNFFSFRKNVWHWFLRVKQLVRRVDHVVTLSENSKQDIIRHAQIPADTISVIYSGISPTFRSLETSNHKIFELKKKYNLPDRFVLFLGTVEPRKNLQTLLTAFELLKAESQYQDLGLVIAGGRGWKAEPIYAQAQASRFSESIIFLDYIPAEEKLYLYNAAAIFVYPSFYEGFGFPPLEAMACGVPVIVSAISSLPEVVTSAAMLIDPYNARSITTAMATVLGDPALTEQLKLAGQIQAQKFNWSVVAQHYLALFKNLAPLN